ncbi:MAG: aryl-sulfate sulfotransferase [Dehalococcoidia bacterium]|nr:aryl-sulfate sulfotransferase [Dehalococcoidia bacterium]
MPRRLGMMTMRLIHSSVLLSLGVLVACDAYPILSVDPETFEVRQTATANAMFPLVQELEVIASSPGQLAYTVHGKVAAGDIHSPLFTVSKTDVFTVIGLYPDHDNHVTVEYYSEDGELHGSQEITISRGVSLIEMPAIEIVESVKGDRARLFLTAHRVVGKPVVIDQFGDLRWYMDLAGSAGKGLQQARNGNILFTDSEQVFEVSLTGEILRTYRPPSPYIGIHHDIHETDSGDLLLTVSSEDLPTLEDVIVLMDRDLAQVTRVWDLGVSIPRNYQLIKDTVDWLHVNAVTFDERDQSLVISGQRRGLYKVSWDNELMWILSDAQGFDSGVPLLTADQAFWGQHDIQIDEENNVYYVFDNGLGRNYTGANPFSRGVKFSVDEQAMTSTVLDEYGTAYPEYFSPIISGIDYDSGGGVLLNFGSIGYDFNYVDSLDFLGGSIIKPDPEYGAAWVEYNAAGAVVMHLRFSQQLGNGLDPGIYRARYVDLFKPLR